MFRLVGGTNIVGEDIVCPTGALQNIPDYEYSTAFGETPLTLENSVKAPFADMHVYGRSEQFTTTGAQLLNPDELIPGHYDTAGEFDKNASYRISTPKISVPSGKTKLSVSNLAQGIFLLYGLFNSEGKLIHRRAGYNTQAVITLTSDTASIGLSFYITDNSKVTADMLQSCMVNFGDIKPWEPYTGGRPSPNPEYPQEIVSVGGATGQIPLVVRGKNLLKPSFVPDVQGVYAGWKIKDDNKNVVISIIDKKPNESLYSDLYIGISRNGINSNDGVVWKLGTKGIVDRLITSNGNYFTIYNSKNVPLSDIFDRYNIQLEYGITPTPYEPYREPQTLLLKTPNGLPGVPVKTGGNYTDKNGQQYICDEIDMGRKKYVERIWTGIFDASEDEKWHVYDNSTYLGFLVSGCLPETMNRRAGFCNCLIVDELPTTKPNRMWIGVNEDSIYCTKNSFYDDSLPDKGLANWKARLAEHPMTVITYLDTPIERDLTQEEIAAYSKLTANDGTTLITVDNENIPTYVSATYPVIPAYGKMEGNTLRVSKVPLEGFKPIMKDTTESTARSSVFIGYADRPDSIAKVYGVDPLDERTE